MSEAYFSDIRSKIVERLDIAQNSIKIAMAWFTNQVLFQLLVDKAAGGTKIELILSGSETNFQPGYSLPFEALQKKGAKINVLTSNDGYQFMHHKFAIIDDNEVITGSYNWSNNAHTNFENILILNDSKLATIYTLQFEQLLKKENCKPLPEFKGVTSQNGLQKSREVDTILFSLSQEFGQEISASMKEVERLHLGIKMTIINGMIARYTAVGAAKKLSNDDEQSGFLKLVTENKADLTFEYLTAKSRYAQLFDNTTIKNAKTKLRRYIGDKADRL